MIAFMMSVPIIYMQWSDSLYDALVEHFAEGGELQQL